MKLLLLRCPVCQNGLQPHDDDVVLICPQCHTPILLDESGLSVYPLRYAQPTSNKPAQWRPFWLFEGLVRLTTRQTQGGGQSAAQMWGAPRRLHFVPAMGVPRARGAADWLEKMPSACGVCPAACLCPHGSAPCPRRGRLASR
jgi:hypothetical protein